MTEIAESFNLQVKSRLDEKLRSRDDFVLTFFERQFIKANFTGMMKILSRIDDPTDNRIDSIVSNILLASRFNLSTPDINAVLDNLLEKKIPLSVMSYKKKFLSPEIIPQQFFLFIKEKLGDENSIEKKRSQYVYVTFLIDNVVGFRFEDSTHWGFQEK